MNPFRFPSPQKAPGGSRGTPRRGGSRLLRLCAPNVGQASACHAPRAFTLVELLVVIGIIALLAALLTPVVMQSLAKARNAAIKAEIDMLHMAIMNYKNEYGSFPPCSDIASTGTSGVVNKHLRRLFPRVTSGTATAAQAAIIDPSEAIVPWLTGYTSDPTDPLANLTPSLSRNKLFDFDQSRINSFQYSPSGKQNAPYIYIDRTGYGTWGTGGGTRVFSITTPGGTQDYWAIRQPPSAANPNLNIPTQAPFNEDTFQILSAGRDEQFGTDDDLSNFWPGTRREYLDSLKD